MMQKNSEKLLEKIINKLEPADIIAFLVITGVMYLNWKGVPTMLTQAVSLIVGFYFGSKVTQVRL